MKLRYTLLSMALLAMFSLLLVPSVFAGHQWYIYEVECFPEDNLIKIYGSLGEGSSYTYIYVDGEFLKTVEGPYDAYDDIRFTVTDDAFVQGVYVEAFNPETGWWDTTRCEGGGSGNAFFDPGDDRINRQAYAPIAIYCAETRLEILQIDADGNGTPAIMLDFASMPATPTDENILVESVGNGLINLYRLTSGEWLATAGPDSEGKTYRLLWDSCPATYIQAFIEYNGTITPTELFPR